MKFSTALTSLVLVLPLFTGEALGASTFGRGKGGKGFSGNQGGNKGGTNNKGAANSTAVASSSTTSAAASSGTSAAAGNSTVLANTGAASNNTASNNSNDPQSSLTLDPKVIATGFESNGQQTPTAGQVASLTSSNNFINFCLLSPNVPITNGQQIKTGSCNPAPMGIIAATTNMPSSKFVTPVNGQNVAAANTAFNIVLAINHLETGNFVNADTNYYSAPQQVNGAGDIVGHSHLTVQDVGSFTSTTPLDPNVFAFFKGLNTAAQGGQITQAVTAGLPAGIYRVCTINTDANHTPCLVAVAQHGSLDDCVYFSVGGNGGDNAFSGGNGTAAAPPAASNGTAAGNASSAAPPAASSAAAGKGAAASSAPPAASSAAAGKVGKGAATSSAPPAASSAAGKGAGQGGKGSAGNGNGGRKAGGRRVRLGDRQSRLGRDY